MARQRECRFSIGALFDTAMEFLAAQEVDLTDYLTRLIQAAYYRVISGDLDPATLKNALNNVGGEPKKYRVYYKASAARMVAAVAAHHHVAVGEFVAAAILLAPVLHERVLLETEYQKHYAGYDPSYLSDSYLKLWLRHRVGVASPLEAQLLALTKPYQLQVARLAAEVERLVSLVEEHLPVAQKVPPPKSRIASATLEELKRIAAAWGIEILGATKIESARRLVLQHFGYSPIIKLPRNKD